MSVGTSLLTRLFVWNAEACAARKMNNRALCVWPGTAAKNGGFSLVELMVVVGIIAIMSLLTAPSLSQMREMHRFRAEVNRLARTLELARYEAVKRNTIVKVAFFKERGRLRDYTIFIDSNGDNRCGDDEPVLVRAEFPVDLVVSARGFGKNDVVITFRGNLRTARIGHLKMEDASTGRQAKISISRLGRVRVETVVK